MFSEKTVPWLLSLSTILKNGGVDGTYVTVHTNTRANAIMWVLLLTSLAAFGTATTFDREESYEEKVQEAYDMLSNVPNAHDTMEFLLKAHELQEGDVDKYTASKKPTEE
ncbi:hypothetical protein KIN20_003675 [Parelaphostrongylus tenuis]|uniref:Uncharacterized protein n=1 Tax=Parelaphostrongylus tenuis TaxID=148309 RepID=A0AAD5M0K9_PARTN|nr:hypothetical protein KIN20_003675 [Parelaphostrongylus tenuis]